MCLWETFDPENGTISLLSLAVGTGEEMQSKLVSRDNGVISVFCVSRMGYINDGICDHPHGFVRLC